MAFTGPTVCTRWLLYAPCGLWLQTKINTSGFKQQRVLTLDKDSKCVWNFNTKMQLRKQIPLSQLVQVCAGLSSHP